MSLEAGPSTYLFRTLGPTQERRVPKHGALAQLGERLICIQEVRSSILLGSTIWLRLIEDGSVAQVVRAHA